MELSSRSGGCGVPASLSSLPPARSVSEPSCSPLQRPLTGLRFSESTFRPPLGVSPSRAVPQPTRIYARGPASPTQGRPQARLSSRLVQLQNRKSEWVTQALRAHAQRQLPGLFPRSPGRSYRGAQRTRRTSGTLRADPFPAPCPLLPQQLSRRVDSGGTVGPKSLCACPEGSIRLRGRLERRWRRERRI